MFAGLVMASCNGGRAVTSLAVRRSHLSFAYVAHEAPGSIDQVLEIRNTDESALAPTLSFVAVDSAGEPLDGVTVSTAFGSDRGQLALLSGSNFDVLAFHGTGSEQVADVRVSVGDVQRVDMPPAPFPVEAQALDSDGQPVASTHRFASVELTNPNPDPITVRVVYLVYDVPAPGHSQQIVSALQFGAPMTLRGKSVVNLPAPTEVQQRNVEAGGAPASVKVYFSRP
jgi:hypothetical protein